MPSPAPFRHAIRVYWEDTDAGGIVYYANHLKFFERARTEWLRQLGISQHALRASTGAIFVVSESHVRYLRPARLDDLLEVSVAIVEQGRVSMTLSQQARGGEELLAEGEIRIACVDAATLQPRRLPAVLTDALSKAPTAP